MLVTYSAFVNYFIGRVNMNYKNFCDDGFAHRLGIDEVAKSEGKK